MNQYKPVHAKFKTNYGGTLITICLILVPYIPYLDCPNAAREKSNDLVKVFVGSGS